MTDQPDQTPTARRPLAPGMGFLLAALREDREDQARDAAEAAAEQVGQPQPEAEATALAHSVDDVVIVRGDCNRHRGRTGTVTAAVGPEWTRVRFADGSFCEGPADDFTPAEDVPEAHAEPLPEVHATPAQCPGAALRAALDRVQDLAAFRVEMERCLDQGASVELLPVLTADATGLDVDQQLRAAALQAAATLQAPVLQREESTRVLLLAEALVPWLRDGTLPVAADEAGSQA